MSLSFLRPIPLPRPSSLCRVLGISKLSTTSAAATSTPITPQTQPYKVLRTPSKNLPIYTLAKRGGNLKQTKVRKIEGDIEVLRTQLQEALGLEHNEVVINQLTKQIIIKVRFQWSECEGKSTNDK